MQLFYAPGMSSDVYELNREESHHCVKVLRKNVNDEIELTDGTGHFFKARIITADAKACRVQVLEKKEIEKHPYYLHIAVAPTKSNDRTEWFLEKATEIGIDEITFLECAHSERRKIKQERMEKSILSAMKQAKIAHKPHLNPLINFIDFINNPPKGEKYIAHCGSGKKSRLKDIYSKKSEEIAALILIGPEGDFSPEEIEAARKAGFEEITLGENRLRTETAGIVACCTINLLCAI